MMTMKRYTSNVMATMILLSSIMGCVTPSADFYERVKEDDLLVVEAIFDAQGSDGDIGIARFKLQEILRGEGPAYLKKNEIFAVWFYADTALSEMPQKCLLILQIRRFSSSIQALGMHADKAFYDIRTDRNLIAQNIKHDISERISRKEVEKIILDELGGNPDDYSFDSFKRYRFGWEIAVVDEEAPAYVDGGKYTDYVVGDDGKIHFIVP